MSFIQKIVFISGFILVFTIYYLVCSRLTRKKSSFLGKHYFFSLMSLQGFCKNESLVNFKDKNVKLHLF